jgi:Resolvase, N terminal domain
MADHSMKPRRPLRQGDPRLARLCIPPTDREPVSPPAPAPVVAPGGRTYGYTRVSTDMQVEHGQSLELQRDQLTGWAQMTQRRIDTLIVESGVSGSIPFAKRPRAGSCLPVSPGAMPWCAPRSTGSPSGDDLADGDVAELDAARREGSALIL